MSRYKVLKDCIYKNMQFDGLTLGDKVRLNTFDGNIDFKLSEVKKLDKQIFYILNNKTNKVIETVRTYNKHDLSQLIKNKKNLRIISEYQYNKEQQIINEQIRKRNELLINGMYVRALDMVK